MQLVIADTSPINYLILIGHIELLPRLFEQVIVPGTVQRELSHPDSPPEVRNWVTVCPVWFEVHPAPDTKENAIDGLDEGETAAILLAESLHADLLLIDERDGTREAQKRGIKVTGTLGVLDLAAAQGMIDFAEAVHQLGKTNFRRPRAILDSLLKKHQNTNR